jgi:Xaa-Pro aminopeptidase
MDQEILDKGRGFLRQAGLKGAMLAHPASVIWLTGYAPPILHGPSPFEGGPALLWLDSERVLLLVSDMEQSAAAATGAEVVTYPSYQIESPLRPLVAQADALTAMLGTLTVPAHGKIGIESLPLHLGKRLATKFHSADLAEIDGWTEALRVVKTAGEIAKIHQACRLCSTAQATLRHAALNGDLRGMTEIAIFDLFLLAMEQQAGERLPVLADLVAGGRTAGVGGLPTTYTVQAADPVLADVVPRLNGYWGDICNVHFAGEPSADLKRYYVAARNALDAAISAVRPGVLANEIDRIAREAIAKQGYPPYPHHTGHGLGVAYHEEPRICGYNSTPLEAGMVIALEPGVYVEGVGGVRLEHVMVVTDNGAEILTNHIMEI